MIGHTGTATVAPAPVQQAADASVDDGTVLLVCNGGVPGAWDNFGHGTQGFRPLLLKRLAVLRLRHRLKASGDMVLVVQTEILPHQTKLLGDRALRRPCRQQKVDPATLGAYSGGSRPPIPE